MKNDDDEEVGYGRPPKTSQFKPGQSGCPDGGHAQRRAKKLARKKKEEEKEKARDEALVDLVQRLAREEIPVKTANGRSKLSRMEVIVRRALDTAMGPDADPRQIAQALDLLRKAKLLEPRQEKKKSQVLVVYPIMKEDAWAKATEGELLPKNPLEGIPGAEKLQLPLPTDRRSLDDEAA